MYCSGHIYNSIMIDSFGKFIVFISTFGNFNEPLRNEFESKKD